jgi:hypothetical protein
MTILLDNNTVGLQNSRRNSCDFIVPVGRTIVSATAITGGAQHRSAQKPFGGADFDA